MRAPAFNTVRAATFAVPDPQHAATYFCEWFGYRSVNTAPVSHTLASIWAAPDAAGRQAMTIAPDSGATTFLRFVEAPEVQGYEALKTHGWNAAELHVQNVDQLAQRLTDSPFQVLGMPRDLNEAGAVRAMQAMGPQGELLYLTEVKHKGYQRTYGRAESPVDRIFIVVLGAANYDATIGFYAALGHKIYEYGAYTITVLARAHGLDPADAKFKMATVALRDKFRIEVDDYPERAVPRPTPDGGVPPGLGIVSFAVDNLDAIDLPFRAPPAVIEDGPIYMGSRAAVVLGPSGEWIELIEG